MASDFQKMQAEIVRLNQRVNDLEKLVSQISKFQQDFTKTEIIRRDVQFLGPVRDAGGTIVIN